MKRRNFGELTRKIKQRAHLLGFDGVGIAPASANPGDDLQFWLDRQYQGEMAYLERNSDKRMDSTKVLEGVRSIISLSLNYFHPQDLPYKQPRIGVISRYASGDDYHDVLQERLKRLLDFIVQLAPDVEAKIYADTGPVMDKHWAVRSGIGWLGKHTNVLSRGSGSWFFLGEILLSLELEYDAPGEDCCGSCTLCIEACPTDAIVEPYVLDGRRCISYLTIELREDIPEEFREPMGNLIFGCDICQDVCPWNGEVPHSTVQEFELRECNQAPDLRTLARLTREDFRKQYRGSPIKRAKWRGFIRNVAVAMGNSGDPAMVPELEYLLDNEDSMICRHAVWALKKIGTPEALEAVRQYQAKNSDAEVPVELEEVSGEQQEF